MAGVSWYCVPDGELKVSCCLDEGAVQALECKHVLLFMCVCVLEGDCSILCSSTDRIQYDREKEE